jgi:type IX secretion system PorP/SprF family membrane protein
MTNNITFTLLSIFALSSCTILSAQDIHYSEFAAMPTVINPSFTGMFDGNLRGSAVYRNQWKSVTIPFVTIGVSADGSIMLNNHGDYIGGGIQWLQDRAGDGDIQNFSGNFSIAYHKLLGRDSITRRHKYDLAIGAQAGYMQSSIDLDAVFFSNNLPVQQGLGAGNHVSFYQVSGGSSFSHMVGARFNYTLGLSVVNINQPNDALLKKQVRQVAFERHMIAEAGFNWMPVKRLKIRPALIVINSSSITNFLGGTVVNYQLTTAKALRTDALSVFMGAWYRTGREGTITAGVEWKQIRFGIAYDHSHNTTQTDNGAFEAMLRYIPFRRSGGKNVPSNRF